MSNSCNNESGLRDEILSRALFSDHLPAFQSGTKDRMRDTVAKLLPGFMVEAEMLAGIDSTQPCLLGRIRKTVEVTGYSGEGFGGYIEADLISQFSPQHPTGSRTGGAVSARVGGIRCSLGREWNPSYIRFRAGIVVGAGHLNRRHRPPKVVGVLCFKERDYGIGHADIQQSKQMSAPNYPQMMF